MTPEATCAICGRSILAGERVHRFLDAAEARSVCDLCVARAERVGWRQEGAPEAEPERARAGGRLRSLLRRPRRAAADPDSPAANRGAAPAAADPAAPGRTVRTLPAAESTPTPAERAVARFNASDAGRTVAGLARTLGEPWVSVGAAAGSPQEVRITVAWDLTWYQWGVDLGDELRPVFQLGKGAELEELDPPARQWNASLGEEGRIRL